MKRITIEDLKQVLMLKNYLNIETTYTISESTRFKEDLGMDSIDIVDFEMEVYSYKESNWREDFPYQHIKTISDFLKAVNNGVFRIGLDVDGVIANFYKAMCDKFNHPYEKISDWHLKGLIDKWKIIENDPEFWGNLPVLNPPKDITFDFDYYITAVPEKMLDARKNWLKKNGFPDKPVIVSHNKLDTCIDLGVNVLIDDKPETINELAWSGLYAIQYIPHYYDNSGDKMNRNAFAVKDLKDVNNIINKINNV